MDKNKKKAILSVTNDLTTDQRVHKVALSLIKSGYAPILVGRKLKKSVPLESRNYETKRIKLFFNKGPFFYAEYNLRLFFLLLFSKTNLLISNDLDSLPANYLVYKIKTVIFRKKINLVYDSHEFFTEVPELNGRLAKKAWLLIEKTILPRLKYAYTVCQSIADEYEKRYGLKMFVVRNIPLCNDRKVYEPKHFDLLTNEHAEKKIILYQGALNIGRGIELTIEAMKYIENTVFLIVGDGDIALELKKLVENENLNKKVRFIGKIPFQDLAAYTQIADIGIILLDSSLSLNYHFALPNRIFDYIQAELPIIASDLPEISKIVSKDDVGILVSNMVPENLAKEINDLLKNQERYQQIKANLKSIKGKYCWEKEEEKLLKLFRNF